MNLRVFDTKAELFQGAAKQFVRRADQAVRERGRLCVALSGGTTPRGLFNLLAGGAFPGVAWDRTYLFWGDERHVPPDHPDSNYRMTRETLLSKVPVPADNVFRIRAEEASAESAAADYEATLRKFFQLGPGQFPRFDLTLNGLGADGHTASLFPGTSVLEETTRLAAAVWVEKFKSYRITLTLPVFNQAACVLFLVTGKEKTPALRAIYESTGATLPAARVFPKNGELLWFIDQEAADGLGQRP